MVARLQVGSNAQRIYRVCDCIRGLQLRDRRVNYPRVAESSALWSFSTVRLFSRKSAISSSSGVK